MFKNLILILNFQKEYEIVNYWIHKSPSSGDGFLD